jgi:hypothetical protein
MLLLCVKDIVSPKKSINRRSLNFKSGFERACNVEMAFPSTFTTGLQVAKAKSCLERDVLRWDHHQIPILKPFRSSPNKLPLRPIRIQSFLEE